jgi:hypothetical protein
MSISSLFVAVAVILGCTLAKAARAQEGKPPAIEARYRVRIERNGFPLLSNTFRTEKMM